VYCIAARYFGKATKIGCDLKIGLYPVIRFIWLILTGSRELWPAVFVAIWSQAFFALWFVIPQLL
jgi:hypothetical protein